MEVIHSHPDIVAAGAVVAQQVRLYRETCSNVLHALQEVVQGMELMRELDEYTSAGVQDAVGSQVLAIQTLVTRLAELPSSTQGNEATVLLRSKSFIRSQELNSDILSQDEYALLQDAHKSLSHLGTIAHEWINTAPSLRHLFEPFYQWLETQLTGLSTELKGPPSASHEGFGTPLLESLLVIMQNTVALCPPVQSSMVPSENDADAEEPDGYLRDHAHTVKKCTHALALPIVLDRMNAIMATLAGHRMDHITRELGAILPFLLRYATLARRQLQKQTSWARTLLKMTYILARVTSKVAKEGFCRPPDIETETGSGDGKPLEGVDGTGIGSGQGMEDVSKEIEDESQVEGLQGEQDEQQQGEGGEGDAIEMSEDVGGEMQDVERGDENEEEGRDEEDDGPEAEEQLGKLDPQDPSAVDEKIWNDEKGPEGNDDKEQKSKDGVGEQSDEVGTKEDEAKEKGGNDQRDREVEQRQEEETNEEVREEDEQDADDPSGAGVNMDDHVQEADTLDLPEDLDLGGGEQDSGSDVDDMSDDMNMDESLEEDLGEAPDGQDTERAVTPSPDDDPTSRDDVDADMAPPEEELAPLQNPDDNAEQPESESISEDKGDDLSAANADVSTGPANNNDAVPTSDDINHDVGETSQDNNQPTGSRHRAGHDSGDQEAEQPLES
jgi:midasin